MIPHCLVFPVNLFVRVIEGVMSTHLENSQVPAEGRSRVRNIHQSNAWLSNNQWVGRRRCDALGDVGLKVDYARVSQVNVASPPRPNRVRLDAGVSVLFVEREKSLPHFGKAIGFSGGRILKERVRGTSFRGGFSAGFLTRVLSPVIFPALRT